MLASAQRQITIVGTITDAEDGKPIEGVNIYLGKADAVTAKGTVTDEKGRYSLTFTWDKTRRLNFSHLTYASEYTLLTKAKVSKALNDTLIIHKKLMPSAIMGQTIDIFARHKPDTVFGSEHFSVEDFEFYEDKMILLVYEKNMRKGSKIFLTDLEQNILSRYMIPGQAIELHRDFEGRVNLLCEGKTYEVAVEADEIILYPRDDHQFNTQIKPVIDTTENKIYFSNYSADYPAFDYFTWMEGDSLPENLDFIVDKHLMELYRSEFKYLPPRQKLEAVRLGMKYKIDKEVAAAMLSGFSQSMYYEPLYAPLFVVDDTVVIFDHYEDLLYRFDRKNNLLDSANINYHRAWKRIEWRKEMVHDRVQNNVYAIFLRDGYHYLKQIDLHTGEVMASFRFTFKYAERIQVKDDYVYYIYRPFESMQKKFLYKELIRPELAEN